MENELLLTKEVESELHLMLLMKWRDGCKIPWLYGGKSQALVADILEVVNTELAKAKQHYKQKRLDRPDREKIAVILHEQSHRGKIVLTTWLKWGELPEQNKNIWREKADQILALFIPDIEEAKKQERERIANYIDNYGLPATYIARPDIECIGISKQELQALKETEGVTNDKA